jgi:hypothetical protein
MSERRSGRSSYTIDLIVFTALTDQLAVLLWRAPETREKWSLPWDSPASDAPLDEAAASIASDALGVTPAWLEQLGAFGRERRHP